MGIFDIGDFITFGCVFCVFVVMRRFDQHNRSLDGVKRFFDKTRTEFDAYMRRNQDHLQDLSNEISSYDKTSKEVLRRIEIDAREVREQAENLNQVKAVMVELLSVRDNVMESLENLKEDATYITEMSRRVEILEQKIQQVEASGDRLLLELAERNEKSLGLQRKNLDIVFEKDREILQNELQQMSIVASDLHQELDGILVQKEEVLVRNLTAYSQELDRVSNIYSQKLQNLEDSAMRMETDGLVVVKQNLDYEFGKIKDNLEKLFIHETLNFKNDLEKQTDSFQDFLNQYKAIEGKIDVKFDDFTNRGQILSDQYNQFDISMHNLYDYIKGTFQDESSQIKEDISQRMSSLSHELSDDISEKLKIVQDQASLRLVEIQKITDLAYQQASGIQIAFEQEQDKLETFLVDARQFIDQETMIVNEKVKELDDLLQNSFTDLSIHYTDWQNKIKGKLENNQEDLEKLYQQKIVFLNDHWEKFEKNITDTSLRVTSELEQGFSEHKDLIQEQEKDLQGKMEIFRDDIAQGFKNASQDLEGNREDLLINLSREREIIRQELTQMGNDFIKASNEAYSRAEMSEQRIFEEIQNRVNDEMKHFDQEIANSVEVMRNLMSNEIEGTQKLAESLQNRYQSVESDLLGKIEEAEVFYTESFGELRSKQECLISLDEEWHLSFEGLQLKLEDDVAGVIKDWRLRADNAFDNEIANEAVRYKDSLAVLVNNLTERVSSSVNNVEDLELLFQEYRENLELKKRDHQLYIEEYMAGWQKEFESTKEYLERKGETLFLKSQEESRQTCQQWQEQIDQWQLHTQEISGSVDRQFEEVELRVATLDDQWRENFVHTQGEWENLWTTWKADQNSLMQSQNQKGQESFLELQGLSQGFRGELYQLKENFDFQSENIQTQLRENVEKVELDLYARVDHLQEELKDRIQGMETTFNQNEIKWTDLEQNFSLEIESKKQSLYEKINEKHQEIAGFVQTKLQDWNDTENKINNNLQNQKEIIIQDFFQYQENFNQKTKQFKELIDKELQQGYKFLEENRQNLMIKFSAERDSVRKELVNVAKDFAKAREEVHTLAQVSEQKLFEEIRIRIQDEMKYLNQDVSSGIEEMKLRMSDSTDNIDKIAESLNDRCENIELGLLAKIEEVEGFYTEFFGDLRSKQEGLINLDEEWKQGFEDLKVKLEDDMSHAVQRWHENSEKNFNQEIADGRLRYKEGLDQVVITLNESVDLSMDKVAHLQIILDRYRDGLEDRKRDQDLYIESYIAAWITEFETQKVRFQAESQTLFSQYSKDSYEVSQSWKDEIDHWRVHVLEMRNSLDRQFKEVQSHFTQVDQQWKISFLSTEEGWQDTWSHWQQDQNTLLESEHQKSLGSFAELHDLVKSFRNQMHDLSQNFENQADNVQTQLRESVNQVESEWYSRVDTLKQELQDRVQGVEQHLETWKNIESTIHDHAEYQKQLMGNSLLQCQDQLKTHESHVQTLLTQEEKDLALNTSNFREEITGQLSDIKSDIYAKISLIKQDLKSNLQRFDQDFTQRLLNAEQIGQQCSENVEKLCTEVKIEADQNSQNLLTEVKIHQEKWNTLENALNEDFDSYKLDIHGRITDFQNIMNQEIVQKMEWIDAQQKAVDKKVWDLGQKFVQDFERLAMSNRQECDQHETHWKTDILKLDDQVQKHIVQTQNLSDRYNHDLQNKFDELTLLVTQYDENFVKTLEKQNQTWSEQILNWQTKVAMADDHLNNYQDDLKAKIDQRVQDCHENVSLTLQSQEQALEKDKQHLHSEVQEFQKEFNKNLEQISFGFTTHYDTLKQEIQDKFTIVDSVWKNRFSELEKNCETQCNNFTHKFDTWTNLSEDKITQSMQDWEDKKNDLALNTSNFREEITGQLSDIKSDIYAKISLIKQDLKSNLQRFDQDFTQRLLNAEQIGQQCSENVEKLCTEVKIEADQNSQNLLTEVKIHQEKWNTLENALNEDFDSYKLDIHGRITDFQNIMNQEIVQKMEWIDAQQKAVDKKVWDLGQKFVQDFERLAMSNRQECDQHETHWKTDILKLDDQVQKHIVQTQNLGDRYNHDLQNKFDELTLLVTQYDENFVKTLEKQNQTWSEQILNWQTKVAMADDYLNNYQDDLKAKIDQRVQDCHENVSLTLQSQEQALEKDKQHLHSEVQEFQKEFNKNLEQISFGFTTHYDTLKQEIQDKFTIVDSVWKNRFSELEKNCETQCNNFTHKFDTWTNLSEDKITQSMQDWEDKKNDLALDFTSHIQGSRLSFDNNFAHIEAEWLQKIDKATLELENKLQGFSQSITHNVEGIDQLIIEKEVLWNTRAEALDVNIKDCETVIGEKIQGLERYKTLIDTHLDTFQVDIENYVSVQSQEFKQQIADNLSSFEKNVQQDWQQNLQVIKDQFLQDMKKFDMEVVQCETVRVQLNEEKSKFLNHLQSLTHEAETFKQQFSQEKDVFLQDCATEFAQLQKGKEEIQLKITHYHHELEKHWDQYSKDFDVQAQLLLTQQKKWVDQKQQGLESLFTSAAEGYLVLKNEYENRLARYFDDFNCEVQDFKNAQDSSQVEVKQLSQSSFELMRKLTTETQDYVGRQRDYIQKQEEDFHGEWKSLLGSLSDQQQQFEQQWMQNIDTWYSQELDLSKLQDVFDQKSDGYIETLIKSMENKSQDIFAQYEDQLILELKNKQQKFLDTQIHLEEEKESLEKLYNDSLQNISDVSQQYETYLQDRRSSVQERERDILFRYDQFFESTAHSKTQLEAEHVHYFEIMRNSKDEFDILKGEMLDKYTGYLNENLEIQVKSLVDTAENQQKDFSEAYNMQRKNLDEIQDFNQIVFRDLEAGKQVFDKQQQTWQNLITDLSKNAETLKKSCGEKIENMTLDQDNFQKNCGDLLVKGEGEAKIILERMQELLFHSNVLSQKFQDKIQFSEAELQEYIKNYTDHVQKMVHAQENSALADIEDHKKKIFTQNKNYFDEMCVNFQEFVEEKKNSLFCNLDHTELQAKQGERLLELENLLNNSQGTIDQCVYDAREKMTDKLQDIDTFLEEFDQRLDKGFELINVYQKRLDQYFDQESQRGKESLKDYLSQFEKQVDVYFKDTVDKFHGIDTELQQEHIVFKNTLNCKLEKSDKLVKDTERRLFEVKKNIESTVDTLDVQQKSFYQEIIDKIADTDTQIQKQMQGLAYNIEKFEKDFLDRRENLDQNLQKEQTLFQSCLDKVHSEIDQKRQQLVLQQDSLQENINHLENEIKMHFQSSKEQLIEKLDQKVLENETFLLQNISEKNQEGEEKLKTVTDKIMQFEQNMDARISNYYDQIKNNFTDIEEVVATSERQLKHYEKQIEDSRLALESRMLVLRDNTLRELANAFEELKSVITGSVHETHEQLCIEFMAQLENRLHEYDGSVQSKMQRLGILLDEFDLLEGNLKSSIEDTSQRIAKNMNKLEETLTFKHQKEAERIAIVLDETNALIPDLQIQIDLIREQTITIVRDRLISFEKEFMHDVEGKENQITHYIEEWQQSVEKILKDSAKQSRRDQEILEKKLEQETESYLQSFHNQTEEEMGQCRDRLNTFIVELNTRSGQIEDDVMLLYQDFAKRTKNSLIQEGEQRVKYLLTAKEDMTQQISHSKKAIDLELQTISQYLSKEKTNFIDMINTYRNDCVVWQGNSQENLKNMEVLLTEDFTVFKKHLDKELEDLSLNIVQTKESIIERLQNEMREVSVQFSDQNENFLGFFESKKDYLEQTLTHLIQRVDETGKGFDDKVASVISDLESIGEKTVAQVEQCKIGIEKDVTQQFEHMRMEVDQLRKHVTDLREQAEKSIESRTEIILNQLAEIETKQKGIEGSLDVLAYVNEMREKFETSLVDLSFRIKDVDEKWDKIIEFEGELHRALRVNDELSERLSTLTQERRKVETLDQKMRDVVDLAGVVERKMSQLTEFSHGIEDIYVRLKELATRETDLQIEFDKLNEKMILVHETVKNVDTSVEQMQFLDHSLQQTFLEISDLKSSLDGVRTGVQMLDSQKTHIESFNSLILGVDQKINDMESRVSRIDEMREWIVQAENRMIDLQKNLKSNLRMTAISRDSEISSGEIGDSDTVIDTIIKLARQGWSSEQIASQLKISVGQVTLVIDRWGGAQ